MKFPYSATEHYSPAMPPRTGLSATTQQQILLAIVKLPQVLQTHTEQFVDSVLCSLAET